MVFYNLLIIASVTVFSFGFQLKHQCGQQEISLKYQNIQRVAFVYIPKTICTAESFSDHLVPGISFNTSMHQLSIPTLVAFHCLGCNPLWELNKWTKYSEQYGFIIIAPKGGDVNDKPSWNADVCCDPAVDKGYDDIGYIMHVLTRIITNIPLLYPYISISFDRMFMTGFSNGAFMVDKLGWNSVGSLFPKILGIAPMAGYIYDYQKYVNMNHHRHKRDNHFHPMAVWMHHSRTDNIVKIDGCCQTNECAAKISERSNECVSVEQEWSNWMKWNQCDIEKYNISFANIAQKHGEYACALATKSDHECLAQTRLCIFDDASHSEWAKNFPLTEEVVLFFLKTLCEGNDGIWNDGICDCNGRKNVGRYCDAVKDIKWDEINRAKKYFMEYEQEHNGTDEYFQMDQNQKYVKKKKHFRRERKQSSTEITEKKDEKFPIATVAAAVVLLICVCLIGWRLYRNKSKKVYKLLPQRDGDHDLECHQIEDDKSDESNGSSNSQTMVRNRRKVIL